ncbi:dTDP-rhamnosyl transferase RfbF [Chelatococcus reniformis]|uniref:dTDP-rhamnosyl transferase RfbF n=1 Tax=Chelatococcus reniformis TaxID=1494448 RepID=A0A916U7B6_9HYPH|nr:dTDP-rhamnosyl transferase RfbF [Chelatococcus reniformis]
MDETSVGDPAGFDRSAVAAGVVLFGPDRARLTALLAAVETDVGKVFAVVNGRIDAELRAELRQRPRLGLIECPVNFGVATALNLLALAATLDGFPRLILFDQDSRPAEGLVARLGARFEELARAGRNPAVVGPLMVAPSRGAAYKSPRLFRRPPAGAGTEAGAAVAVDVLATSGSLIALEAFCRVGKFRDDYFIDAVDVEWCFRAWARGYSCWIDRDVTMIHTVGEGEIRIGPVATPRQKAFRMGAYVRNTIYGFRLGHVPARFKLRQAAYLPMQALLFWVDSGLRPSVAIGLGRAAWAGLRGRLGPPAGAPDV